MAKIQAHIEPSEAEKRVKEAAIKREEIRKQRQGRLDALADKKVKSKLTLEDLDTKLDIVIEMLTEAAK